MRADEHKQLGGYLATGKESEIRLAFNTIGSFLRMNTSKG